MDLARPLVHRDDLLRVVDHSLEGDRDVFTRAGKLLFDLPNGQEREQLLLSFRRDYKLEHVLRRPGMNLIELGLKSFVKFHRKYTPKLIAGPTLSILRS